MIFEFHLWVKIGSVLRFGVVSVFFDFRFGSAICEPLRTLISGWIDSYEAHPLYPHFKKHQKRITVVVNFSPPPRTYIRPCWTPDRGILTEIPYKKKFVGHLKVRGGTKVDKDGNGGSKMDENGSV